MITDAEKIAYVVAEADAYIIYCSIVLVILTVLYLFGMRHLLKGKGASSETAAGIAAITLLWVVATLFLWSPLMSAYKWKAAPMVRWATEYENKVTGGYKSPKLDIQLDIKK